MSAKSKKAKGTSSTRGKKGKARKGSCFTIMPFGGWFDDYYAAVYVPAIDKAGLRPVRADDLYRPSTIVADIWSFTKEAKLVLADLSGKNPNVFYELGLAHALARPVILVVATMDDVPFDLRALRVLEYDKNNPNWGPILEEKITNAIGEVLANPALSVPSAFLEAVEVDERPVVSEQEKRMVMLEQEVDRLRRESQVPRLAPEEHFGPDVAERQMRNYLRSGYTSGAIVRRLVARGAPESWVRRKLDELQEEEYPMRVSSGRAMSEANFQRRMKARRAAEAKGVELKAKKKPSKKKPSKKKPSKKKPSKKKPKKKSATKKAAKE